MEIFGAREQDGPFDEANATAESWAETILKTGTTDDDHDDDDDADDILSTE